MGLGVPKLRALFLEAFGHHTASNNGSWLRRKLCEKPDAERGRGRSAAVRKRDQGAAIWTTGTVRNITQARPHARLLPDCAPDARSCASQDPCLPSPEPNHGLCGCQLCDACVTRAGCLQAEAKVLVANGPVLANGSFIAIPEASGGATDAGSVANSPHDTPSVTPTKHIQHKVTSCAPSTSHIKTD